MIISCLVGVFLFKANFIHSYFVGVPTNSPVGTVFMRPITDGIQNLKCCVMRNPDGPSPIETVTVKKGESNTSNELGNKTVVFKLVFKPEIEEREATEFIIGDVKTYLYEQNTFIKESGSEPVKYSLIKLPNGKISANITTIAIARHPTQLYFSIACLILFISFYWIIKRNNSKQGLLGGIILIVLSIIYFLIEFINLPIAESTKWQGLLANQWLSLLLALAGVSIFIISKIRSSDV